MNKWITGKIAELIEVNPSIKFYKSNEYPFVSMEDLKPYNKLAEPKETRKFSGSGSRFQENDVLFARITPCLENGKTAQVKNLKGGMGFGSTEFLVFRGKDGISDSHFVYYLASSPSFRNMAIQLMVGTSGRQRVDKEALLDIEYSIPPLHEQQKIASILGSIDEKIELNRRINKTLEQMAMTLYYRLLSVRKNKNRKVSDYVIINPSISIKKGEKLKFLDMKAVPTDAMSVELSDIQIKPFNSGSRFQKGDTLFARITPCLENGKTAFVDFLEDEEIGFGSTEFLVLRPTLKSCPQFVYCLSRDEAFREYAIKRMVGTSGRQRVQASTLSEYEIPEPDPEMMGKFREITKDWFSQITLNTLENHTLKGIRNYLLPRLLSEEKKLNGLIGKR